VFLDYDEAGTGRHQTGLDADAGHAPAAGIC
jgi:hypothetical protein